MTENLVELVNSVNDEESFLLFAKELRKDRKQSINNERGNPSSPDNSDEGGWENTTIEDFLEGAIAWADESKFGRHLTFPEYELSEINEWRRFAYFLLAGRKYE